MASTQYQVSDALAIAIAKMRREELVRRIVNFPSPTKLDFTPEFLEELPTDKLRHILACALGELRRN